MIYDTFDKNKGEKCIFTWQRELNNRIAQAISWQEPLLFKDLGLLFLSTEHAQKFLAMSLGIDPNDFEDIATLHVYVYEALKTLNGGTLW